MNEVDVVAQQREAKRLQEEQERKIAKQEADVSAMQELQKQSKASMP
jgi:hypothetical protein